MNEQFLAALQAENLPVSLDESLGRHTTFRIGGNADFFCVPATVTQSRVTVNGRPAKASVNVKVGDIIEIAFGQKTVKVKVLNLLDTTKKEEAKDLFEYI